MSEFLSGYLCSCFLAKEVWPLEISQSKAPVISFVYTMSLNQLNMFSTSSTVSYEHLLCIIQ